MTFIPQVLQPAPMPDGLSNMSTATGSVERQQWLEAWYCAEAYRREKQSADAYLRFGFPNWLIQIYDRPETAWDAPALPPPNGLMVKTYMDNTSTEVQYDIVSAEPPRPVCAVPAFVRKAAPVIPHAVPISSVRFLNVPAGDALPVGAEITGQDGQVWVKRESETPFGPERWYERKAAV
jgi:hypothetical protein